MTAPVPVGTIVGAGFIVMSLERREGKMPVRCPVCRKTVWKHQSNLSKKVKSCGCEHGLNQSRRYWPKKYGHIVDAARVAFATDTAYAIAMARAAARIQDRKHESSAIVVDSGD